MPINTLADIEIKVRRLTRSPSLSQLSQQDLDNYINTFVVYDFPEHLRTFNLRQQYSFYCEPFQDTYVTDKSLLPTDPLYDFQNQYLTLHPPVYIAGYQAFFTQSREQFFGVYPKITNIQQLGVTGDGVTRTFQGTIPGLGNATPANQTMPILPNEVQFTSVDISNQGLVLVDTPLIDAATLKPTNFGLLYVPTNDNTLPAPRLVNAPYMTDINFPIFNFINYITGQFYISFPTAPGQGQIINSQSVPYQPSLPMGICYYQNKFILRPVPDQPYKINFEVYKRPTELLSSSQEPNLQEWWQYIAIGSAIKIFQDRFDFDSVNLLMPEFKAQENLMNRRTLIQYTNERTATIYTENVVGQYGAGFWYGGGSF